jgi:hypothetical protein
MAFCCASSSSSALCGWSSLPGRARPPPSYLQAGFGSRSSHEQGPGEEAGGAGGERGRGGMKAFEAARVPAGGPAWQLHTPIAGAGAAAAAAAAAAAGGGKHPSHQGWERPAAPAPGAEVREHQLLGGDGVRKLARHPGRAVLRHAALVLHALQRAAEAAEAEAWGRGAGPGRVGAALDMQRGGRRGRRERCWEQASPRVRHARWYRRSSPPPPSPGGAPALCAPAPPHTHTHHPPPTCAKVASWHITSAP